MLQRAFCPVWRSPGLQSGVRIRAKVGADEVPELFGAEVRALFADQILELVDCVPWGCQQGEVHKCLGVVEQVRHLNRVEKGAGSPLTENDVLAAGLVLLDSCWTNKGNTGQDGGRRQPQLHGPTWLFQQLATEVGIYSAFRPG